LYPYFYTIFAYKRFSPACWQAGLLFLEMSRSSIKGPYVDPRVLKKIEGKKPTETGVIKTWSRACQIAPEMVGFTFGVHNGREHIDVFVTEDMVGHRLGEFSLTRKFIRHGGKMQKELEQKQKEAEISAAKAAKGSADKK
jgi:small subunit ribosomal protein S19